MPEGWSVAVPQLAGNGAGRLGVPQMGRAPARPRYPGWLRAGAHSPVVLRQLRREL